MKNNHNMQHNKRPRYGVRKTSLGVGSIIIGSFLLYSGPIIYATENNSTYPIEEVSKSEEGTEGKISPKDETVFINSDDFSNVSEIESMTTHQDLKETTNIEATNNETTNIEETNKKAAKVKNRQATDNNSTDVVNDKKEWRKVNHYSRTNQSINFDDNWKFNFGDVSGVTNKNYDDTHWVNLNLPHDFSIGQSTTPNAEAESGYKLGGVGWYRKTFSVTQEVINGRVQLQFDGSYMETEVFINGVSLGVHPNGYTSFTFDLTNYLKANEENQIAIKVVNKLPSSRWYSGSGLYRSVRLNLLPAVHIEEYGVSVKTPNLETTHHTQTGAVVQLATKVVNQSDDIASVSAKSILFERQSNGSLGTKVAETDMSPVIALLANQSDKIEQTFHVINPKLWSVDSPNLYILRTELYKNGEKVQTTEQETGFRYFSFHNNTGFKLNGQSMKLQGVSMHHDQGALGASAYYDAIERQFTILKDMGVNAVRVTHNPASRVMKDIANRKGMLLIDEAFDTWEYAKNGNYNDYAKWFNQKIGTQVKGLVNAEVGSQTWAEFHIKQMVRSGINDPSIIMWSTGNEVMEGFSANVAHYPEVIAKLIRWIDNVDGTRPTTLGDNKLKDNWRESIGMAESLTNKSGLQGIVGYNYANGAQYDAGHNSHPNWIIYGSETASAVNSRGVYNVKGNTRRHDKQLTSYDQSKVGWGHYASEAWYDVVKRDFVSGEFVWTGFDYLGEPTPWNGIGSGSVGTWPAPKSSYFGIVDTAGFPKDSYYFYRSQWQKKDTTLHILPAWHESVVSKDSQNRVEVVVYSNAHKVKLIHVDNNGVETDLGTKTFTKVSTDAGHTYQIYQGQDKDSIEHRNLYLTWHVSYRNGKIKAIAYDENNVEITDTVGNNEVVTFNQATRLNASVDKVSKNVTNQSLAYVVVDVTDDNGNLVITDKSDIRIDVSGPAQLIAMDNGDATDHQLYQEPHRKAFGGKVLAILKMTGESGQVAVTATANNLISSGVTFDVIGRPKDENDIAYYTLPKVIYTRKGDYIDLPTEVLTKSSNNVESERAITFNQTEANQKIDEGTSFVATGIINGSNVPVDMYVSVLDKIGAVKNISTAIEVNGQLQLPETVEAYLPDGTLIDTQFPVEWETPQAEAFNREGIVVVQGYADVLGERLPVTATVRVSNKQLLPGQNVAPVAVSVSQDIPAHQQSDTLSAVNNNDLSVSSNDAGGPNPTIWSNYEASQAGKTDATLTFTYDTAQNISQVIVYYHRDSWALRLPKATTFSWSRGVDETPQTINATVESQEDTHGLRKVTYNLEQPIPAVLFNIHVQNSDENLGNRKTSVGIAEVELITAVERFDLQNTARLSQIRIGDTVINEDDFSEEILVDSLDGPIEASSLYGNVGITVLPEHNGVIRIMSESEDKTERVMYTLRVNDTVNPNSLKSQKVNHAIGATAIANDSETDYFGPDKAIDGIVNRQESGGQQSRWATNVGATPKILTVTLPEVKSIEEFLIYWERENIKGFRIETSLDGQNYTPVYTKTDNQYAKLETTVTLSNAIEAKYVRLVVDNYDGGTINWQSVSVYDFQIIGHDNIENLAYTKETTANASEADTLQANNATDGNLDTRWASSVGHSPKTIQVDLGQPKDVASIVLEWERKNVTDYTIQLSLDGINWTDAKHLTRAPKDFKDVINLDEHKQARYVKLVINQFNDEGETRSGRNVSWPTVSLHEFEVYGKNIVEPRQIPLSEIANSLVIPPITGDMGKWQLPSVPDGVSISFIGADFEQIIDNDLTVYQPLVDTTVSVNYKLTRGDEVFETSAIPVVVSGKYRVEETDNAKLNIVPGLAEWKGLSGQFKASDSSRIVIHPKDKDALSYLANSFKEDYKLLTGRDIDIVYDTTPQTGDFYFELNQNDVGLKEEGYLLTIGDYIQVEANHKTGAFWSTQTLLQALKLNDRTIDKGIARDYPKYSKRGFVLDVGRKPIELAVLKDMIKALSWYKYNDFQIHLNDNYIWVEEKQNTDTPYDSYSAFRLESNIKKGGNNGLNKEDLTAKDLFYTKQEFKELITLAKDRGIKIVPEFDTPAHALAFTKVRPDLTMSDHSVRRWVDHLEVSNPEALEFVKSVWNEYIDSQNGQEATFNDTDVIHIGVDEFEGNNEAFRQFIDQLIKYAISKGKTPRIWGSLTAKNGNTPVQSEGVEMNVWNSGWARPIDMYKQGYKLINTLDGDLYIVPAAGYYYDYLNSKHLYDNWEPNNLGGTIIPAGSSQMAGAAFAIWNDMIDKRANGILSYDIFKRFESILPALSAKMWGNRDMGNYDKLQENVTAIGSPVGYNPYSKVSSASETVLKYNFDLGTLTDTSGNQFDGVSSKNVFFDKGKENNLALQLNGGTSYVKTPVEKVGPNNSLSVWVKLDNDSQGEQILAENNNAAIKLVQKDTGKVGYSTEGYHHSYNYTLPKGEWVHLMFKGYENKQELYVNGELVDTLGRSQTGEKYATLVLPTQYIGSQTYAVKGLIDNLVVLQEEPIASKALNSENWTISSNNENSNEPIGNAFDGDILTNWHTQWNPNKKELPATIEIDMKSPKGIDLLTYVPRQIGTNGNISHMKLYGKLNEQDDFVLIKDITLADDGTTKTVPFNFIEARYLKIEVLNGVGGFGSAAEFIFSKTDEKTKLKQLLVEASAHIMMSDKYVQSSYNHLLEITDQGIRVYEDNQATTTDIQQSIDQLQQAINALQVKPLVQVSKEEVFTLPEVHIEKSTIQFEEIIVYSDTLLENVKEVVQEGRNGEKVSYVSVLTNKDGTTTRQVISTETLDAINQIVKVSTKVDKQKLSETFKKAKQLSALDNDYTKESLERLLALFNIVQIVLDNETATPTEINSALALLKQNMDMLEKQTKQEQLVKGTTTSQQHAKVKKSGHNAVLPRTNSTANTLLAGLTMLGVSAIARKKRKD